MVNTSGKQTLIVNSANGRQTMNEDAARYYNALVQNIKDETGFVIVATEGTRTWARQNELYQGYVNGRIDPSTGQKYNPAWSPNDSRAYHLSGRAVDVGSSVGYVNTPQSKAFYARAGKYGFRPTVAGEPWHFEWRADWVSVNLDDVKEEITEDDTEDQMFLIQRNDNKKDLALVGLPGRGYIVIRNEAHYAELQNAFNASGVKLTSAKGRTTFPAWKSLSGYYVTLSPTGYDEILIAHTVQK